MEEEKTVIIKNEKKDVLEIWMYVCFFLGGLMLLLAGVSV